MLEKSLVFSKWISLGERETERDRERDRDRVRKIGK